MATIKSFSGKSSVNRIINYVNNGKKTNGSLISGYNCSPENVKDEMKYTKTYYNKKDDIQYYHVIQSFKPGEIEPEKANKLGLELVSKIAPYYECLVVTHIDKGHIHNHIIINSVSYKNGRKYQVERGAYKIKKESDKICERENLSIVESKKKFVKDKDSVKVKGMSNGEYRAAINKDVEWWKGRLIIDIKESKIKCQNKDDFINDMESKGYKVNWSDTRKYITYTTPSGNKVRDNKLHDENLLKEAMENGFRQIVRKEYDRGAESKLTAIAGATRPGIIASTTNRIINGSKQKFDRAEDSIPKPSRTDLYSKFAEQGENERLYNSTREDGRISTTDFRGSGRVDGKTDQYNRGTNTKFGQVHKVSSERGSARSKQEFTEASAINNIISREDNFDDDRGISNFNFIFNNNNRNDIFNKNVESIKKAEIKEKGSNNTMDKFFEITNNEALKEEVELLSQEIRREIERLNMTLKKEVERLNESLRKIEKLKEEQNLKIDKDYFKMYKETYGGSKYNEQLLNELEQFLREQRYRYRKEKEKSEPKGLIYDFCKKFNKTTNDIIDCMYRESNKLTEQMSYGILSVKQSLKGLKEYEPKINKNDKVVEKMNSIKSDNLVHQVKLNINEELAKASKTNRELYKELEAIKQITDVKMYYLNDKFKKYNELLKMGEEFTLYISPEKMMESINIYKNSRRNIEQSQAELIAVVKGETIEQQQLKNTEKAFENIERAEKRIQEFENENKFLDFKGNYERGQMIKELKGEIKKQTKILKNNGINSKEEFKELQSYIHDRESMVKDTIERQKELNKTMAKIEREAEILNKKDIMQNKEFEKNMGIER